jgi:S-formylglutathione hydrolase FrmB
MTTTQVLLPDGGKGPFPVLYLLHGLSDDASTWLRRSRIEVYVKDLPLVVVMPDGYRGFYTDNAEGPAYARHVGEELSALIERTFPVIAARSARAIGGLSMGGYGALRLGLGYAERYCSIHSHSGALGWDAKGGLKAMAKRREWSPEFVAELTRVFGRSPAGGPNDLVALAKKAKRARRLPAIALDCGTEDYLLADNRAFVARLREAGIPFEYREHPGAHDWDYWDLHVRAALRFHARNLGIA